MPLTILCSVWYADSCGVSETSLSKYRTKIRWFRSEQGHRPPVSAFFIFNPSLTVCICQRLLYCLLLWTQKQASAIVDSRLTTPHQEGSSSSAREVDRSSQTKPQQNQDQSDRPLKQHHIEFRLGPKHWEQGKRHDSDSEKEVTP